MQNRLDNILSAYVATALWSSTDGSDEMGGEPFDANYSYDDIAQEALEQMRKDCVKFLELAGDLICLANFKGRTESGSVTEHAMHDFWLTRNHHGAGFWDGDYEEPAGTRLTEIAQSFPECDLYLGDDGKIYLG